MDLTRYNKRLCKFCWENFVAIERVNHSACKNCPVKESLKKHKSR